MISKFLSALVVTMPRENNFVASGAWLTLCLFFFPGGRRGKGYTSDRSKHFSAK
jgi:hypothetical protein